MTTDALANKLFQQIMASKVAHASLLWKVGSGWQITAAVAPMKRFRIASTADGSSVIVEQRKFLRRPVCIASPTLDQLASEADLTTRIWQPLARSLRVPMQRLCGGPTP